MTGSMRAARLHTPGQPMQVDLVDMPVLDSSDVLIRVEACGVIPNMNAIFSGSLWNRMPPLPAVVGLDASGVVVEKGASADGVAVGDRVYVNPWLTCGTCHYCRTQTPMLCDAAAFQGYFGFFDKSEKLLRRYPYGGFSQYMTAAPGRLVHLPESVSFDHAARFGYLGTSFSGLKFGGVGGGTWLAINGITGTLGVGATLIALSLGATRILGTGRNRELLAQVKALSPARVDTLALGDEPIDSWIRDRTDGVGVDVLLDCSGRASDPAYAAQAVAGLKRGGSAINAGALSGLQLDTVRFMTSRLQFRGSNWFTTGEAQQMTEMAAVGALDLSPLTTTSYALDDVNTALSDVKARPGGFTNLVIHPNR